MATDIAYGAVIFDMDGVVTDTAAIHAAAWKALFDEQLPRIAGSPQPAFDVATDYRDYVDGRSRTDGVRTFLAARGLIPPEGTADDSADAMTVHGLAARKQQLFTELLDREGVRVFPDAKALLTRLRVEGVPTALVTASRNSPAILAAAGVADLFTTRVDGADAAQLALPGKPDPATFLLAAHRLNVRPADAVVIEDSEAGIEAAVAGGFGLVVGADRAGAAGSLTNAGAHLILTDLTELDLTGPRPEPLPDGWLLAYDGFDPAQEGTREARCALANGYWATRAAFPGSTADDIHYPGTYLAGIYNRTVTRLDGGVMESEHLVNAPDWTHLTLRGPDGHGLLPESPDQVEYYQELDLRRAILARRTRFRDAGGRVTVVATQQFLSLDDPHLAALRTTVEAVNWSGCVVLRSGINGQVTNRNVIADAALTHQHLDVVATYELDADTVVLESITRQSRITIAVATRTRISGGPDTEAQQRHSIDASGYIGHETTVELAPGCPVMVDKIAAVATSRDLALSTAGLAVQNRIRRAPGFDDLAARHTGAAEQLWRRFGIGIHADRRHRLALNFNTFHVMQTVAAAHHDLDAGPPARGLHGEGYRGHIFWDELFVYPMLTLRRPDLTRALLHYRFRRLDEARAAARAAGLAGAMFPWQSGSDGRDETPAKLFNILDGQWMPDNSHLQRHVGLGIAYSVWQYYQATGDIGFLITYGAEILVEVARLFASLAVYHTADDRYDIAGVMGPDEFHDGYPDAPGHGVRNNAYTNVLAAWVLTRANQMVAMLAECDCEPLWARLSLADGEQARWDHVSRRLRVPFHDGVISQFEGYQELAEFDWSTYRSRYGNIGRLDLILQSEGDSTNNYRMSKQADVLMLFYLFSAEELRAIFTRLGYRLPARMVPRTVRYYLDRTSHGSTLSRLIHSWVLARTDRRRSWALLTQALQCDLSDTGSGTTREGIHLGAMAGSADMMIRCYAGVETRGDILRIHPLLPEQLPAVSFQLAYRGQPIDVQLTHAEVRLQLHRCTADPIRVCVEDVCQTLRPGDAWDVALPGIETSDSAENLLAAQDEKPTEHTAI